MLGEFDFHLLQVQYIKAAMDQLPTFAPLGMTPAQMQAEYDAAVTLRTSFQGKIAARNLARGEMYEKMADGHQTAIGVYGVMKTRYRKDPGALEAILKLPTQDRTVEDTTIRMEAMSALWGQLPLDPNVTPPAQLIPWPGLTKAVFDAKLSTLKAAQGLFVAADEDYEMEQGDLHAKDAHLADLAVAALAEGRAQFVTGTPQREVIDSIPTTPASQAPNKAVITVATSPGAGQAHLEFNALHGTSFDVLHKGPGETEFTTVANDIIETVYNASGLAPGNHEYKVIGQNSRGNGPESEISIIAVA